MTAQDLVFNEDEYLLWNPDVLRAVWDKKCRSGLHHYEKYGSKEGRVTTLDTSTPVACDAVMVVTNRAAAQLSLESLLRQENATVFIHLIDPSNLFREDEFLQNPFVEIHRRVKGTDHLSWIHYVIPQCRTKTILFQQEGLLSTPQRAGISVNALETLHATIYAGTIVHDADVQYSEKPDTWKTEFTGTLLFPTVAIRKNDYIDVGGFGKWDSPDAKWYEFITRLAAQNRPMVLSAHQIVTGPYTPFEKPIEGPALECYRGYRQYRGNEVLVDFGTNYNYRSPVAVDIIMTIHDNFDFASAAIKSIMSQHHCHWHLHLVDDASTMQDGIEYLNQFHTMPYISTYFNRQGIGPYQTVNNLYPYLRHDYLAIHDADDLSFPSRFYEAINALEISRSDLFFSSVTPFGSSYYEMETFQEELECHATMVIRKSAFRSLGGYTDTGVVTPYSPLYLDLIERSRPHFSIYQSKKPLLFKRQHFNALSRTPEYARDVRRERHLGHLRRTSTSKAAAFGGLGKYRDMTIPINRKRYDWVDY